MRGSLSLSKLGPHGESPNKEKTPKDPVPHLGDYCNFFPDAGRHTGPHLSAQLLTILGHKLGLLWTHHHPLLQCLNSSRLSLVHNFSVLSLWDWRLCLRAVLLNIAVVKSFQFIFDFSFCFWLVGWVGFFCVVACFFKTGFLSSSFTWLTYCDVRETYGGRGVQKNL